MGPRPTRTSVSPSMATKTLQKTFKSYTAFNCKYCKRHFQSLQNLRLHLSSHTDRKFICSNCPNAFRRKDNLVTHEKIHTGQSPYNCDHCKKSFLQNSNLKRHLATHAGHVKRCRNGGRSKNLAEKYNSKEDSGTKTKIKPYSCKHCSACFINKNNFKRHLEMHTREETKPFDCRNCGRSFPSEILLNDHSTTHLGKGPFECDFCGKRLTRNNNLQQHLLIHCQKKPLKCPTSNSNLKDGGQLLQKHLEEHLVASPFECKLCSYSASRKISLIKHEKTHQRQNPEGQNSKYDKTNNLLQELKPSIHTNFGPIQEKGQKFLPLFKETKNEVQAGEKQLLLDFKKPNLCIQSDEENDKKLNKSGNDPSSPIQGEVPRINEQKSDENKCSQKFKTNTVTRLVLKPFKCRIRPFSLTRKNYLRNCKGLLQKEQLHGAGCDAQRKDQKLRGDSEKPRVHSCKKCGVIFSENKELSWHYYHDHKLPTIVLSKLPISVGDIVVTD